MAVFFPAVQQSPLLLGQRYRCGSRWRWWRRRYFDGGERYSAPPAAAQRLEESNGVGEAGGFGIDARERGLQVGLLGLDQQRDVDFALLDLPAHEIDVLFRR